LINKDFIEVVYKVFNNGDMKRDFTYIDDIVEGIAQVMVKRPEKKPPYNILNIGKGSPTKLLDFIEQIEVSIGGKAKRKMMQMQSGDVKQTWADTNQLETVVDYTPQIEIIEGVNKFANWFKAFKKK
jgi:UDP-glucuronate 4-epimerase